MAQNLKQLEDHVFRFVHAVREFGKILPMTVSNVEDLKELIKASGQVGAMFVQAMSAGNRKSFSEAIVASGQQFKQCQYWLKLVDSQGNPEIEHQRAHLIKLAGEMVNVYSQVLKKSAA